MKYKGLKAKVRDIVEEMTTRYRTKNVDEADFSHYYNKLHKIGNNPTLLAMSIYDFMLNI